MNRLVQRINELTQKQKDHALKDWEKAEQEALRQEYLHLIRQQFRNTLEQAKPSG